MSLSDLFKRYQQGAGYLGAQTINADGRTEAADMETLLKQQEQQGLLDMAAEMAGASVFKPSGNAASSYGSGLGSSVSALNGLLASQMYTAKDAQNLLMPVQQPIPQRGVEYKQLQPQTMTYVRSLLGV